MVSATAAVAARPAKPSRRRTKKARRRGHVSTRPQVTDDLLGLGVLVHRSVSEIAARIRAIPALIRDFTVPSGIRSASAISGTAQSTA